MTTQHEQNVEKLLGKIVAELKTIRADLARRAGEPDPFSGVRPKSEGGVTSVTRGPGHMTVNDTNLPTALTPEQQEAMRAQRPGYKEVARTERVKPADERPAVKLSDEQLRAFSGRRDVLTTRDLR